MNTSNSDAFRPPSSNFRPRDGRPSTNDRSRDANSRLNYKDRDADRSPDLLWLSYETRLRKLMQELLQPTVKRSREDRELHDTLAKNCDILTKRVEELEAIHHRAGPRQTIFDDLYSRISTIDTLRKAENSDLIKNINDLQAQISGVAVDYNHLRDSIQNVGDLTQHLSENFTKNTLQLDEYKKSFASLTSSLQMNINQNAEAQKESDIKLAENLLLVNNDIVGLRNLLNDQDLATQSIRSNLQDLGTKTNNLEGGLLDHNKTLVDFLKHIEMIKQLKVKAESVELRTRTNESYLEKYLPIFIQCQVSETLHHCLNSSNKSRLHVYEDKKFKEMNNNVLHDDGNPDLQKKIQSMQTLLETTVKRYTKSTAAQALGSKYREPNNGLKHTDSSLSKQAKLGDNGQMNNASGSIDKKGHGEDDKVIDSMNDKGQAMNRTGSQTISNEDKNDRMEKKSMSKQTIIGRSAGGLIDGSGKGGSNYASKERIQESEPITRMKGTEQDDEYLSDADSDLNFIQSKQIEKLQNDLMDIKEVHEVKMQRIYEELHRKIQRVSQEQLEFTENTVLNAKRSVAEFEVMVKSKKKDETEKVLELDMFSDNLDKVRNSNERCYHFLKRLNDTVVPLIETINSLLVLILKEEKEKKSILHALQQFQGQLLQPGSRILDEPLKKRKEGEHSRKPLDFPYLSGTKIGQQSEEKIEPIDVEIKFRYNDRMVRKMEFLELTFDNFKDCIAFATKFRLCSNFAQFFEGELSRVATSSKGDLRSTKKSTHLLYEERNNEKETSAGAKGHFSRMNRVSYKNYMLEGNNSRILDKRKSSLGLVRDKDDHPANKSFY